MAGFDQRRQALSMSVAASAGATLSPPLSYQPAATDLRIDEQKSPLSPKNITTPPRQILGAANGVPAAAVSGSLDSSAQYSYSSAGSQPVVGSPLRRPGIDSTESDLETEILLLQRMKTLRAKERESKQKALESDNAELKVKVQDLTADNEALQAQIRSLLARSKSTASRRGSGASVGSEYDNISQTFPGPGGGSPTLNARVLSPRSESSFQVDDDALSVSSMASRASVLSVGSHVSSVWDTRSHQGGAVSTILGRDHIKKKEEVVKHARQLLLRLRREKRRSEDHERALENDLKRAKAELEAVLRDKQELMDNYAGGDHQTNRVLQEFRKLVSSDVARVESAYETVLQLSCRVRDKTSELVQNEEKMNAVAERIRLLGGQVTNLSTLEEEIKDLLDKVGSLQGSLISSLETCLQVVLRERQVFPYVWVEDKDRPVCSYASCRCKFSVFRRRHHCRCCGEIFCWKHCQGRKKTRRCPNCDIRCKPKQNGYCSVYKDKLAKKVVSRFEKMESENFWPRGDRTPPLQPEPAPYSDLRPGRGSTDSQNGMYRWDPEPSDGPGSPRSNYDRSTPGSPQLQRRAPMPSIRLSSGPPNRPSI